MLSRWTQGPLGASSRTVWLIRPTRPPDRPFAPDGARVAQRVEWWRGVREERRDVMAPSETW